MNTITAKELRDNLGDIAKRVSAGEEITVSYRNKLAFRLAPTKPVVKKRKPLEGLEAILHVPLKETIPDKFKKRPIKELYHEMLEDKYGQK